MTDVTLIEASPASVYFTNQHKELEALNKTLERISEARCQDIAIDTPYANAIDELEAETLRALTAVVRTYIHGDYFTSGLMAANKHTA